MGDGLVHSLGERLIVPRVIVHRDTLNTRHYLVVAPLERAQFFLLLRFDDIES